GVSQAHQGSQRLNTAAGRLHDGASTFHDGAAKVADGQRKALTGTRKLGKSAHRLDHALGRIHRGAAKLHDRLTKAIGQIPNVGKQTREQTAATIGDPVAINNVSQSSAGNYGAGLAPFFMSLAAWIGGYVLFLLLRPLSKRAMAASQTPLRVALAGWYTPALLGVVQVLLLFLVVWLGLSIVPANLVATAGFLVLTSACFIAMVHTLNAWLGATGQFLGLVLMVLQLVSAGGTFPWQTLPGPLQALHHVLPMSYAIDGLRHLMYGGDLSPLGLDCGVLVAYLIAALVLSAVAARRQRVWTPARIKPELVI
ncbi:MAG: YhgE/Pip family protein, partial [Nocardioidaceae bacterium]